MQYQLVEPLRFREAIRKALSEAQSQQLEEGLNNHRIRSMQLQPRFVENPAIHEPL